LKINEEKLRFPEVFIEAIRVNKANTKFNFSGAMLAAPINNHARLFYPPETRVTHPAWYGCMTIW